MKEENERLGTELQKRIAAVATHQLSRSASFGSGSKKMRYAMASLELLLCNPHK